MLKFKFFAPSVLLGLLTTTSVGCGTPEAEVIIDKQTAAELQAEREAHAAAMYAKEPEMKGDPNAGP